MASILDITLLDDFAIWFTLIFIFVVVYALLQSTKFLGESRPLHAMLSLCVAFLMIFSKTSVKMVQLLVPWLTVMLIFAVLMLMFFKLFGASSDNLQSLITNHYGLIWTLVVMGIIFVLVAFGYARGQVLLEETQGQNSTSARENMMGLSDEDASGDNGDAINNAYVTIFHPKVLGLIFTLAIAVFAISMLTGAGRPPWPPID